MTGSAIVGLVVMIVSEAATLAHIEPFWSWNTPIAWTGFILFADGFVWSRRGNSWLRSAPGEFACLAVVSIPLWLVFEFFNGFIDNWYYVGLPENPLLRSFGYAWSFATIWPALFEAAELVAVVREGHGWADARHDGRAPESTVGRDDNPTCWSPDGIESLDAARPRFGPAMWLSTASGAAMLVWPAVAPAEIARYLAAPVWLGFIFLLDPVNARLGAPSLIGDVRAGRYDRGINLMLGGLLCGILWEFWNYWSRTKWHYAVPIMTSTKVFEMPFPGYFGFPPFALECFTMYVFVRAIGAGAVRSGREASRPAPAGAQGLGRTIAL